METSLRISIVCGVLAAILLAILLTGCTTADRRVSFGNAVAGQCVDVATTMYAMQQEGLREGNPLFGDRLPLIVLTKAGLLLVDYKWGDARTDWAVAAFGYAAGIWNIGVTVTR